jgi:N-methylhydantoinase B
MMRSSYSPIFSESRDFSCALFDRRGQMIAQGRFCPAQLGAMPETVRCTLDELGVSSLEDGDVVVHNDPFRGGCHMPEHLLLRPIFHDGSLVAFAATIGHMAEIGAMAVGSFAGDATEVYQEGLRLPPVKLVRRGERVDDVWKIILTNHRTPRATWGDLHAMIGSLLLAERRFVELLERYDPPVLLETCDRLIEHGERLMRRRIAEIPDGDYAFEDVIEDDGITDDLRRIRVTVRVRGDRAIVDYTGTDPQARGPVNATYGVAASAAFNAFLQISGADLPRNAGAYRSIKTIAPLGSAVNVRFPGPSVGGNTETQPKLVGMILGAFAPVLPDRVMAAEGVTSCNFLFGGIDPRTGVQYAHYHFEASGWGGRQRGDGANATNHIHGNCRNTPVEIFELRFPWRVRSYGLVPDSGGPGRHRGGLAVRRVLEVQAPEITVSSMMDRVKSGAWGLFGGGTGRCAALLVRRRGEPAYRTFSEAFGTVSPSKFANIRLREGDEVVIESAGGAGFGDPFERDPQLVRQDVLEGLVGRESAKRDYGVAFDKRLAIDEARTAALRRR